MFYVNTTLFADAPGQRRPSNITLPIRQQRMLNQATQSGEGCVYERLLQNGRKCPICEMVLLIASYIISNLQRVARYQDCLTCRLGQARKEASIKFHPSKFLQQYSMSFFAMHSAIRVIQDYIMSFSCRYYRFFLSSPR